MKHKSLAPMVVLMVIGIQLLAASAIWAYHAMPEQSLTSIATIHSSVLRDPIGLLPWIGPESVLAAATPVADTRARLTDSQCFDEDATGLLLQTTDCGPPVQNLYAVFIQFNAASLPASDSRTLILEDRAPTKDSIVTIRGYSTTTIDTTVWSEGSSTGAACPAGLLGHDVELATFQTTTDVPPETVTVDAVNGGANDALWDYIENRRTAGLYVTLALQVKQCGNPFGDLHQFNDRENSLGAGSPPLSVELLNLSAEGKAGQIVVQWITASEISNEGFNIYRSEAADGEYVKINEALIPAQGNPSSGASYSFEDTDVKRGRTYYYKLEDVDTSGNSTFHGPVSATVRGKGR